MFISKRERLPRSKECTRFSNGCSRSMAWCGVSDPDLEPCYCYIHTNITFQHFNLTKYKSVRNKLQFIRFIKVKDLVAWNDFDVWRNVQADQGFTTVLIQW